MHEVLGNLRISQGVSGGIILVLCLFDFVEVFHYRVFVFAGLREFNARVSMPSIGERTYWEGETTNLMFDEEKVNHTFAFIGRR